MSGDSPERSLRSIADLAQELAELRAERDALRLIVTEKFAGADLYVKPEDAADVAKWVANVQHVRELLKHEPMTGPELGIQCADCLARADQSHHRDCLVAAAWRALGDPHGQADIERAHEEALPEQARRTDAARRCSHAEVYHHIRGRELGGAVEDVCRACGVVVVRTPCRACDGTGITRDTAGIAMSNCWACRGRGTQRPRS